MTEALDRIVKEHRFESADIEEIRAGTNKHALDVISLIREPKDLTSAQFSGNFSLALFLAKGNAGFQEYTEENLADPRIGDLARKIRVELSIPRSKTSGRRAPARRARDGAAQIRQDPHRMRAQPALDERRGRGR